MNKELSGMVKALGKPKTMKKKRSHSVYTTVPVSQDGGGDAAAFHSPGEALMIDKVFPNGDKYSGQWVDGCPNGKGKYSWTDGCKYAGRWREGKVNGKGKFTWPSGATYEGHFKSGHMKGEGVYIDSNRNTYKGAWLFDMKHGMGTMTAANGDRYEGEWDKDTPEGQGSYEWKNGNKYIGKWKQGKMNGNGTMTWANGNVYDGSWMDGLPKGNGTFRWADGSFYAGEWSNNKEEHDGTYYPSSLDAEHHDWDPQEVYKVYLADCNVCLGEKIMIKPSEKIVKMSPEGKSQNQGTGKPRRASMDEGLMARPGRTIDSEPDIGSDSCNEVFKGSVIDETEESRQSHIIIKPPKRKGLPILKGHKNYDFTCSLQLGLKHGRGRATLGPDVVVKASALDNKEKKWTKFPPVGSSRTPVHQLNEFKWKDYCPTAFRMLMKQFKVDPAEYVKSICGSDPLRDISSASKGGSNIYLTSDDKYIIKTLKKAEVKAFLKMLPAYCSYVRAYENTFLSKFYGLHCVKFSLAKQREADFLAQKKVRFVIMENLFRSNVIHRCFDLKGSSHGRSAVKPICKIDSSTTLKDVDLNFIFKMKRNLFEEFCTQLDRDGDFLEHEGLMGYSLLLGVHFPQVSQTGEPVPCEARDAQENLVSDLNRDGATRLGINMPARAELTKMKIDFEEDQTERKQTGVHYNVILHVGIIDILQDYDITKKLQHAYKSFQYDPTLISAVSPKQYSRRFREYMLGVFTAES